MFLSPSLVRRNLSCAKFNFSILKRYSNSTCNIIVLCFKQFLFICFRNVCNFVIINSEQGHSWIFMKRVMISDSTFVLCPTNSFTKEDDKVSSRITLRPVNNSVFLAQIYQTRVWCVYKNHLFTDKYSRRKMNRFNSKHHRFLKDT